MPELKMKLTSVRGYSAYEIALQHGFVGTEEEWLESLHGSEITVNNKSHDANNNINIYAANIPYGSSDEEKVISVKQKLKDLANADTAMAGDITDLETAVGGKLDTSKVYNGLDKTASGFALDARQGKALNDSIATKASQSALNSLAETVDGKVSAKTATVSIAAADWAGTTTVQKSVSGVTASNTVIVFPAGSSYVAYGDAVIRCTAQTSGKLTFKCTNIPTSSITVNVLILNGVE